MNTMSDIVAEYYPRPADEVRYCAIGYYAETTLTNSVYVLNCDCPDAALKTAERYFRDRAQEAKLCRTINRIEILPENAGRWSKLSPVLVKTY